MVFVDTAAWLALVNKTDSLHKQAKTTRNRLLEQGARFVMTDYILVEIANALSRIPFKQTAVNLISSIKESSDIEVVEIDKSAFDEAWELYSSHLDKEWGFTDCTSFVTMKRRKLSEVFTSDHHFEQAGFKILLTMKRG